MLTEIRGMIFLFLSLAFFLTIVGLLTVGAVMRPVRWSERPRHAS
jgi:hypothetical protein